MIPSGRAAAIKSLVKSRSDSLGCASPEGWLCAAIRALALDCKAREIICRNDTCTFPVSPRAIRASVSKTLRRFRYNTRKCSSGSACKRLHRYSPACDVLVILCLCPSGEVAIRREISIAAVNCATLAFFTPFTSSKAKVGTSAIPRKEPNILSSCRAISTALMPRTPTRNRIATNSASVSASAPRESNRSRGRSSSDQEEIPVFLGFNFSMCVEYKSNLRALFIGAPESKLPVIVHPGALSGIHTCLPHCTGRPKQTARPKIFFDFQYVRSYRGGNGAVTAHAQI